MWSVLQTNLAWTLFFPIENRRKFKKKKKLGQFTILARNFYLITSPERQDELSTNFNPVNGQRGRVTRASCSRKESIDPIVVSQVKHRITLIFTSLSGWSLLMYIMYVFRTYVEPQENGQLLNAIRST